MRQGAAVAAALGISLSGVAQAQQTRVTETAPPPLPPAVVIPAPPPIVTASSREEARQRVVTLDVRVFGGTEELWNRPLILRGYGGAQATLEVSEASSCPLDTESGYSSSQRTGLRLQISQRGNMDRFQINATWTRRSRDCAIPGTLTAGLDLTIELAPGQTRTVTGDGGLRVVLSRQR